MDTKPPGKLVQNLREKIKERMGEELNFPEGCTAPKEEWISVKEMSPTKVITLRTAEQTLTDSENKLHQFNPSSFLGEDDTIPCRVPGCEEKPEEKPKSSSGRIKQDLFLCKKHCEEMVDQVSQLCEKEKVHLRPENYGHDDFKDYTLLIRDLEISYMHLLKKLAQLHEPIQQDGNDDLLLAEVFLNARNYLIITNALLNPNDDNIRHVLPAFFEMLIEILHTFQNDPGLPSNRVAALRIITRTIMNFFGIIFPWVSLNNPGAQVGEVVGSFLSEAAAPLLPFPLAEIVAGVIGPAAGRFFGGAAYAWCQSQLDEVVRQYQREREYNQFAREQLQQDPHRLPRFCVLANLCGSLLVIFVNY